MRKKKLPKFNSDEEFAEFWMTHSPLDYEGLRPIKNPFRFSKKLLKRKRKGDS